MAAASMIFRPSNFQEKAYLFFACLMLASNIHAQAQILIPYRNKDKWGFADTTGKLIVNSQFDAIIFDRSHPLYYEAKIPKNHYLTKVDSLFGLVGPHLIIPNQYRFIKGLPSEIFVAQTFSNFQTHFYSKKGERILQDAKDIERLEFSYFRKKGKLDRSPIHLIKIVLPGRLLSVYAYYPNEFQKSHFIIEDCASILKTNQFEVDRVAFKVQKNRQSDFEIITLAYDAKTDRFEVSTVPMASSDNYGLHGSGSGSGTGNGGVSDSYPEGRPNSGEISQMIQFSLNKTGDSIFVERRPLNVRFQTNTSANRTLLPLPKEVSNIQSIAYVGPLNKQVVEDSVFQYRNYLQFKINQKTCVQFFESQTPICYDSVLVIYPNNNGDYHLLAGLQQADSSIAFGITNDSNQVVIPFEYEEISGLPENKYQNINYKHTLVITKKNNLYGLLTLNNKPVLPCRYEAILPSKKNKNDDQFFELNHNGLNGAFFQYKPRENKPPVSTALVEPFTENHVKSILYLDVDENASEHRKVFPLLQITTQEGKLVGYFHPKGLKFWND
jgi:hypothetical protein